MQRLHQVFIKKTAHYKSITVFNFVLMFILNINKEKTPHFREGFEMLKLCSVAATRAPPIIRSCSITQSNCELSLLVKHNKLVYSQPNQNHDNHEKVGHKI